MKNFHFLKSFILFVLVASVTMSCEKDDNDIKVDSDKEVINSEPIAFKITGSVGYDGLYKLDENSTATTPRYVHETNPKNLLKTIKNWEGEEAWALSCSGTIYYLIEKTGDYPPESGWRCGGGLDKPNFKVVPVYE